MENVVLLIGRPFVGKTTSALALAEHTGVRSGSCSPLIYEEMAKRRSTTVDELRKIPKEELRKDLADLGNVMLDDDPAVFGRKHLGNKIRIIDGIRRRKELLGTRDIALTQGHHVIIGWVERDGAPDILDNTEVTSADADLILPNHGTHADLSNTISQIFTKNMALTSHGHSLALIHDMDRIERGSRPVLERDV